MDMHAVTKVVSPALMATYESPLDDLNNSTQAAWEMERTCKQSLTSLRHHNASLMVTQLPHELLSIIFLLVVYEFSITDKLRLTHVCKHWREAAIGTARLWRYISDDSFYIAKLFMSRSRGVPLNMLFTTPEYELKPDIDKYIRNADRFRDIISFAQHQIGSLTIAAHRNYALGLLKGFSEFPPANLTRLYFIIRDSPLDCARALVTHQPLQRIDKPFFVFLESLDHVGCKLRVFVASQIHALPSFQGLFSSLEYLQLKRNVTPEADLPTSMTIFMGVLIQCTSLVYLDISEAGPLLPSNDLYPAVTSTVNLPKLRVLCVEYNNPEDIAYLLAILVFPNDTTISINCFGAETFHRIFPRLEHRTQIKKIIDRSSTLILTIEWSTWSIRCFPPDSHGGIFIKIPAFDYYGGDDNDVVLNFFLNPLSVIFGLDRVPITTLVINIAGSQTPPDLFLWTELFSRFPQIKKLCCNFSLCNDYVKLYMPDSDIILDALSQPSSKDRLPCLQLKELHIGHTKLFQNDFVTSLEARDAAGASHLEILEYTDVVFVGYDDEPGLTLDSLPDLSRFVDKFEVTALVKNSK
ncbi:hypothetical protein C8Q75DRAFT_780671 [Abortiporus biennis]|nr:hypothetical protein C8Q75DRAFT_780671 [Abortiporus biennis]